MNKELAPVVMVGYSRPWTLKKSLKNLSENYGLGDRDVYFFQDAPYRDEDIPKVEAMYQVALEAQKTILPQLIIVRRERNFGVPGNLLSAVRETMDHYGRIIFFEDDVLVSKTFVQNMEEGLRVYQNDPRIFCINGYAKGIRVRKSYPHDVYLSPRNSAWGWASWKDRWDAVDFDMKDWSELKRDCIFLDKLYDAGCDLYDMAELLVNGKIRTWDLQCTVHMVRNGLFAVEPRYNLTRNIGFGAEGVNCHGSGKSRKKYYNFKARMPHDISPDGKIWKQFKYTDKDDRLWAKIRYRLLNPFYRLLPNAFEEPLDVELRGAK